MNTSAILIHFVFTPKYRRAFFADAKLAVEARRLFHHIATLKGIEIRRMAIQPDHVHLFVELPRTMSVAKAAMLLKWFTSIYLRLQFPHLLVQRAFWGHRYWAHSVGGGAAAVSRYIDDQMESIGKDLV
jgi:putative transposase